MTNTEKAESGSWKERIEKEFSEIAREKSDVDARWNRIKKPPKDSVDGFELKEGKRGSILKKIKDKILPVKKTANAKRRKMSEIHREKIALEKKKDELRRKREELEKRRDVFKN